MVLEQRGYGPRHGTGKDTWTSADSELWGRGDGCLPSLRPVVYLLHRFLPIKLFVQYFLTVAVLGFLMVIALLIGGAGVLD